MKTTIDDVAQLAGVSIKTVSRVINHEPSVRSSTQEKVQKAIDSLGYTPNTAARSFASKHSFTIACLYDNPNAYYVTDIQQGLLSVLRESNFELIIHPVAEQESLEKLVQQLKSQARVAGVVLTSPFSENEALLKQLNDHDLKYVRVISAPLPAEPEANTVYVDDCAGARQVTEHLVDLGHRDIACIMGAADHYSSQERIKGYRQALNDKGIEVDNSLISTSAYTFDAGVSMTHALLKRSSVPTAILAGNDEMAVGALSAVRAAGLKCPEDIAIAGFENSPFSQQSWPPVTTAHQNNVYIAKLAARRLLNLISNRPDEKEPLSYTPRLMMRESTQAKG